MAKATFAPSGDSQHHSESFQHELNRRVKEYFAVNDLSGAAGVAGVVGIAIKVLMLVIPYALILSNTLPVWAMCILAMMVGAATSGMGFSAHEGAHGAVFKSSAANTWVANGFTLLGVSLYNWKIAHNSVHHTYTNIYSLDEDLTTSDLMRYTPVAPWKPFYVAQHLYAPFVYSFAIFYLVFVQDFRQLFMPKFGPYEKTLFTPARLVKTLLAKALYLSWTLVIPMGVLDLPPEQIVAGFFIMHLAAGFVTAGIFMTAHVVEGIGFPVPDANGKLADDFGTHQLKTTADYACDNKLLSWYVGGLNFQLEHHLFPHVASQHYPAIHTIVKEVCRERGLPLLEFDTFWSALKSHVRHLKAMGQRPAVEPNPVWVSHKM